MLYHFIGCFLLVCHSWSNPQLQFPDNPLLNFFHNHSRYRRGVYFASAPVVTNTPIFAGVARPFVHVNPPSLADGAIQQ